MGRLLSRDFNPRGIRAVKDNDYERECEQVELFSAYLLIPYSFPRPSDPGHPAGRLFHGFRGLVPCPVTAFALPSAFGILSLFFLLFQVQAALKVPQRSSCQYFLLYIVLLFGIVR